MEGTDWQTIVQVLQTQSTSLDRSVSIRDGVSGFASASILGLVQSAHVHGLRRSERSRLVPLSMELSSMYFYQRRLVSDV